MKGLQKYIVLFTILFQATIILMFNTSILGTTSLEDLKQNIPFFNVIIVMITVFIVISFKKLGDYETKQAELKLVKTNMKAIEELITLLRTERHDYISHIQAIQAMLYLEEYKELDEYIKGIAAEYRVTSQIIRVGHPALTALLNSKREIVQEKGIYFHIDCRHKIDIIEWTSWELCSLFSNLIENAIEAVTSIIGEKWIRLTMDDQDDSYMIEIENPGQIEQEVIDTLHEPGVSTKDSVGRGYGLHICKKIVDKYSGTIEFKNTKKNTVVFTVRLPRGENNYDTKAIS